MPTAEFTGRWLGKGSFRQINNSSNVISAIPNATGNTIPSRCFWRDRPPLVPETLLWQPRVVLARTNALHHAQCYEAFVFDHRSFVVTAKSCSSSNKRFTSRSVLRGVRVWPSQLLKEPKWILTEHITYTKHSCLATAAYGGGGGGGGGFFLACEDFWEMFDHSFPACAFFFSSEDYFAHTHSTLYARISPQWLSK